MRAGGQIQKEEKIEDESGVSKPFWKMVYNWSEALFTDVLFLHFFEISADSRQILMKNGQTCTVRR